MCPELSYRGSIVLLFVQIFIRNIIFRHLVGVDFPLTRTFSVFHTRHDVGLKCVPFLNQLPDTLRICAFGIAQSL